MFNIHFPSPQQIAIITIDADKKIGIQIIKIFQTLRHPECFPTEFIS